MHLIAKSILERPLVATQDCVALLTEDGRRAWEKKFTTEYILPVIEVRLYVCCKYIFYAFIYTHMKHDTGYSKPHCSGKNTGVQRWRRWYDHNTDVCILIDNLRMFRASVF